MLFLKKKNMEIANYMRVNNRIQQKIWLLVCVSD